MERVPVANAVVLQRATAFRSSSASDSFGPRIRAMAFRYGRRFAPAATSSASSLQRSQNMSVLVRLGGA